MKFAALGRTSILLDAARAAISRGHVLTLVGTAAPAPEYTAGEQHFMQLAMEAGCPCFIDEKIDAAEAIRLLEASGAEVAISINWPRLMRPSTLSRLRHGVVNAHAGDLPRYRGNACPNWAILNGESEVVITLHQMDAGLDSGPILSKRRLPVSDHTYIGDIYAALAAAIPDMFADLLDDLENGRVRPQPQPADPALALRCFPRRESDSEIDWAQPAVQIARLVRASAEPFSGAYSWLDGRRVRVWRARPGSLPYRWVGVPGQVADRIADGPVTVLCGDGVLVMEEIEIEGAGRGAAGNLVRRTRMRFGTDPSIEIANLRRRIDHLESRLRSDGKLS